MTVMKTRIGGWSVISVKDEGSAWITYVGGGDVPESLSTVTAGDREAGFTTMMAAVSHWQAQFMWHYPQHLLTHSAEDMEDCVDCAYGTRVMFQNEREDTDEVRDPLPQVHEQQPEAVAVWHKGRRVTSMSDYYTVGSAETGDLAHYCHVEALGTTGEQMCATARLDEITYSAYRPTTRD
jgi:hypothetical protein